LGSSLFLFGDSRFPVSWLSAWLLVRAAGLPPPSLFVHLPVIKSFWAQLVYLSFFRPDTTLRSTPHFPWWAEIGFSPFSPFFKQGWALEVIFPWIRPALFLEPSSDPCLPLRAGFRRCRIFPFSLLCFQMTYSLFSLLMTERGQFSFFLQPSSPST